MTGDFFFGSYDDSQEREKVKTDQPVGTFFFFFFGRSFCEARRCVAHIQFD